MSKSWCMQNSRVMPTFLVITSLFVIICGAVEPGNGVWRLKLSKAAEKGEELQVWIEVENGIPERGYAMALSISNMVSTIDLSQIEYNNNTLQGRLGLEYIRDMSHTRKRTYEGFYDLDCTAGGGAISGTYSGSSRKKLYQAMFLVN